MICLLTHPARVEDSSLRNIIKASAGKRRLGERVNPDALDRDGTPCSLSRSKWGSGGSAK